VADADADDEALDEIVPDESGEMTLGAVHFGGLSPTEFEEFCFDLLSEVGFVNVDWRKGTPRASSPADRGRDIVAYLERADIDGHRYMETWFVDCKHYERGVPPEALQGATTWAQAERPSTVLFIASGYLTNGAKDWIADYERSRPPFRIRVWEMPQLRRLLVHHMDVAFNHDVQTSTLRRVSEILTAQSELTDKLWYGRSSPPDADLTDWDPKIVAGMRAAQRRMQEQYGIEELLSHVASDFEWGMLSGKVSALRVRWVLGDDWDMLDT
jgi:hypothetical protein